MIDKKIGRELHKAEEYAKDPHEAIFDFIMPFIDKVHVGPAKVLVATYRQKEALDSGLLLTQSYLDEDRFQGITGLILKAGPLAFEDYEGPSGTVKFGGFIAKPGDWVIYAPEKGRATELAGLHCRVINDVHIDAVVDLPDLLW